MKNTTQATSMYIEEPIRIGFATAPEERREVYQFRYSIYAEEIAYDLTNADHQNKLLYDELDEWAILLTAHIGSTLIGTARINIGKISDFPSDLVHAYRMDKFKKFYNENDATPLFAIFSRGMISPQYRSSATMYLLGVKLYELCCDRHIQFAFLNCTFHLIPFYENTGHIRIDKNTVDPNDKSPLASFVLLMDNVDHLRAVQSPLFRIARKKSSLHKEVVDWFYSEFAHEINTTINSRFITAEDLWTIIYQYLGKAPNQSIPILKDLSILEAKIFIHSCSSIVHCQIRDHIVSLGNTSQEHIILLSGKAYSSKLGIIYPGQCCGENGLACSTTHTSSAIALDDLNILVFSFYNFGSFQKRHPNIAHKVIRNIQK